MALPRVQMEDRYVPWQEAAALPVVRMRAGLGGEAR